MAPRTIFCISAGRDEYGSKNSTFSEYPYMEDDTVIIRKMTEADAEKCGFEKKYTDIYED